MHFYKACLVTLHHGDPNDTSNNESTVTGHKRIGMMQCIFVEEFTSPNLGFSNISR